MYLNMNLNKNRPLKYITNVSSQPWEKVGDWGVEVIPSRTLEGFRSYF